MYRLLLAGMKKEGYTKKETAQKAHIEYQTFLKKSNGKKEFTLDEALRLQQLLNLPQSVEEIFTWAEKE